MAENRIISALDKYSRYITEYGKEQINIAEKTKYLLNKKELSDFSTKLEKEYSGVNSYSDILKTNSKLFSEAVSIGNEALSLISNFSDMKMKEIGYTIQEKTADSIVNSMNDNVEVLWNNELTTVGKVKEILKNNNLPNTSVVEVISKLPAIQYSTDIYQLNNKDIVAQTKVNPITKEIIETDVNNLSKDKKGYYYNTDSGKKYLPGNIISNYQKEKLQLEQTKSMVQYYELNLKKMQQENNKYSINTAKQISELNYYLAKTVTEEYITRRIAEETKDLEDIEKVKKQQELFQLYTKAYTPNNFYTFYKENQNDVSRYLSKQSLSYLDKYGQNQELQEEILAFSTRYKTDKYKDFRTNYEDIKEEFNIYSTYSEKTLKEKGLSDEQISLLKIYEQTKDFLDTESKMEYYYNYYSYSKDKKNKK